jgi:hypothetical protein
MGVEIWNVEVKRLTNELITRLESNIRVAQECFELPVVRGKSRETRQQDDCTSSHNSSHKTTPILNLRAVSSSQFPHVAIPEVSKSPLLSALTHSKAPEIYFFSGWAGVAIKFMDSMPGESI